MYLLEHSHAPAMNRRAHKTSLKSVKCHTHRGFYSFLERSHRVPSRLWLRTVGATVALSERRVKPFLKTGVETPATQMIFNFLYSSHEMGIQRTRVHVKAPNLEVMRNTRKHGIAFTDQ